MVGRDNLEDGWPQEQESRRRLGEVMLRTAGELGYHRTTVGDILERSGESRERFYGSFAGKEECFAIAYKRVAGDLTERMLAAGRGGEAWDDGLGLALEELLAFVAAEPLLASALIVEVRASTSASDAHDRMLGRLAAAVDRAREEPGARASVPPIAGALMVGAIEGYLREMLIRRESERAPEVLGDFVFLVVLPYFGEDAAFEAMDSFRAR
jgi:AcrR family transcriptional regulator